MEFRILGPLEVADAGTLLALGGPRHRRLLAVLLVHAGAVVSTEHLIQALWGQRPPESAASMVHVRVSELRKLLRAARPQGAGLLRTQAAGYVLQVGPDDLDARRFERLAVAGRQALTRGDPDTAAARLGEALALWRGPALVEVADEPSAQPEIARLEQLRLQALEDRVHTDLARGRHAEVAGELEALVAEHPLRERLWGQLMLARYRAGRQGEALQAYQAARAILVEELGIDPGAELRQLQAAILRQDPALSPPTAATVPRGNLPVPLTSLVGRERELAEIAKLLEASSLVTLTGAGGVGKSRLALEIARTRLAHPSAATWLVDLAGVHDDHGDPDLVAQAVATVLGVHEHPERPLGDLLAEHLRTASVLLVLDNCEHLLQGVARLAHRLLAACPYLHILVTSRQRLGVTGEFLRPLLGLGLPAAGETRTSVIEQADAVRLFVDRATAVQPGFGLSDATAMAVAQICQRLDGLPLAIELAAARMSALGVEQLAARLGDRFGLLTQDSRVALPRHQALRAVVEWSYELLEIPERRLFDRLAVFVGGFTLEAAETVCADAGGADAAPVPVLLSRLVDRSLVTVETAGAATHRYRLLDTLRAYALERLQQRGETDRLRARHAAFYRTLAEAAGGSLRGPEQSACLQRLETEHGNLRAALDLSVDTGDAEGAVRLAGSLYPFWDLHGHYREGRRWLDRALAMRGHVPAPARARGLLGVAALAVIQGDLERAAAACSQAAALSRRVGYAAGLAHALSYLGFVAMCAEELDRAEALLEESVRIARPVRVWEEGWSLLFLALLAMARGEPDQAAKLAEECHMVLRRVGDPEGIAWTLIIRAAAAWTQGKQPQATASLRAGLRAFQDLDGPWGLSLGLFVAAQLARASGHWHRAARLLGASEALRDAIGAGMFPFVQAWLSETTAAVTAALGPASFERAWQAGQALSRDAAVAEAMHKVE